MTKRALLYGRIALLLLVVTACTHPPAVSTGASSIDCQGIVDGLVSVRTFPELADGTTYTDFLNGLADGTLEGFDVNDYFSVLTHLSMEPSYTLDYVYDYGFLAGEPILYARPVNQAPYETYSAFAESEYPDDFPDIRKLRHDFTAHIQVDDTPEGFFELLALRTMGSQFYLYWHGAYHDAEIVCNQAALEALIAEHRDYRMAFSPGVLRKTRAIDFEPVIALDADTVTVRLVIFTDWGGFIEETTTLSRSFPHTILLQEQRVLVEYDCGIVF